MNLDSIADTFKGWLDDILHVDWLSTAITMVVAIIITAICAHIVTKLIKKLLHVDKNPLPASSIFVNIGRVCIWVIGICVILSSCFNVNISAAITALGIGGLAVSLGFQATLANLVAGLQVSLTKLVVPGDRIRVGSNEGIVDDVTWRHTRIITVRGERVIIPNSLMNTDALIKLPPESVIRIALVIQPDGRDMNKLLADMESQVDKAVKQLVTMVDNAKIQLTEVTDRGYHGTLTFTVMEGANIGKVKNAALNAVSNHLAASKQHNSGHRTKHVKVSSKIIRKLKGKRK